MKQLTTISMAAAVVALAASSASAQALKADIPFTFQVSGTTMSAGTYVVMSPSNSGSKYVLLRNTDTKKSVMAMYTPTDPAKELKARGTAGIQFECAGPQCALRQIWSDSGSPAYGFRGPKLGSDGDRHMAFIPLTNVKAD
jgi:hypothetical protein